MVIAIDPRVGRHLDALLEAMKTREARRGRKRRRRFEPKGLIEPILRRPKPPPANPLADPHRRQRYPMEFAPVDIVEIRARFHASQRQFARMIGISVRTLRNWEQGKRRPQGTARALLRVAAANPNLVAKTLLTFRRVWWMDW